MPNFVKKFLSMWDSSEEEYDDDEGDEENIPRRKYESKDSKVLSISRGKTQISCFKPTEFDGDIADIANKLISGNVVIMDLEISDSSPETSRRIVDFLRGAIFAIQGKFVRVSKNTYVLTPSNVEINGTDLINELANHDIYI
jgi:cell division inhibitor SepF